MRTVKVNFVGGDNKSRSRSWSSQSSINLYVDTQRSGKSPSALLCWPGEKAFSAGTETTTRGIKSHAGSLFVIADTNLVEIDSAGNRTTRGQIPGLARCSMETDGTNLLIRTGSQTYNYTGGSVSLLTSTVLQNAQTLAYINNQVIYQGSGQRFYVADAGDPTTINALNFSSASGYPDDLVQVYAFNERLYLAGSESIEVWYNSESGTPPFLPFNNGAFSVGVASPFSMANSENFIYFLGSDDVVYRISQFQPDAISTSAISKEMRESFTADAEGYVANIDGQNFYILQLPTAGKTLAVSESTGEWITLSAGVSGGRHLMSGYEYAYGKHLITDYDSGDVYEWDFDTHVSNSETLIRQRDSAPISSRQLGVDGRLLMSKFELIMETGVGNTDVPDPEVMMSVSIDGGRSYTNEVWVKIGREGEAVKRVEFYLMKSFYEAQFRVRVSDPCFIGIHGATVNLKSAGW